MERPITPRRVYVRQCTDTGSYTVTNGKHTLFQCTDVVEAITICRAIREGILLTDNPDQHPASRY